MKILLVDDELHHITGLKKMILKLKPDYTVYTCKNGEEALQFIKENPCIHLLITDIRMPKLDGLTLVNHLQHKKHMKIVILSGFSDFEYAQKAIRFGVSEYLLKPVDSYKLNVLLNKIEELHSETSNENNIKKKKIGQLIIKSINLSLLDNEKHQLEQFFSNKYNLLLKIKKTFQFSLLNMDEIYYSLDIQEPNIIIHDNEEIYILFIGDNYKTLEEAIHYLKQWYDKLPKHTQNNISVIRGSICNNFIDYINHSRQNIVKGEKYQIFNEISTIIDYEKIERNEINYLPKISKWVREIESFLYEDKLYDLECNIKKIFSYELTEWTAKEATHKILLMLLNPLNIVTPESERLILAKFYQIQKRKLLCKALLEALDSIENYSTAKVRFPKKEIIQYIKDNFKGNISMQCVAEQFYFSPSYFSKQFNKHMRMTFNKYLNQVRIEYAIELLKDPTIKIYEVAKRSGYSNVQYFIKIFNELNKISPKQYRKKMEK